MPRRPAAYVKGGKFCTSAGGVQHRPLCDASKGRRHADLCLARFLVQLDEWKAAGGRPADFVFRDGETAPPTRPSASPTVPEALMAFFDRCKADCSPATLEWVVEKARPLNERFALRTMASITTADIQSLKSWLKDEKPWNRGKRAFKGLSNTTVNHHLRAFKSFFNWACKPSRRKTYGLLDNPAEEVEFLVDKQRERVITDEEMAHLLANCADGSVRHGATDFREALTVMMSTTMRPQELRLLKWEYVRWDTHMAVFPPEVVKTRKRRETTLLDNVEQALRARMSRLEGLGLDLVGKHVFCRPGKVDGVRTAGAGEKPMTARALSHRFRLLFERCVRLGLVEKEKAGERLVSYSSRHGRITRLAVQGVSPDVIMRDAGHANPATTQRYIHLASTHVADAIRAKDRRRTPDSPP